MGRLISEYDVENRFLTRLEDLQYSFVGMQDYTDILTNFRVQICKFNEEKLAAAKGTNTLSDSEFDRLMTAMDGVDVYEAAKFLRQPYVLPLDNGESVYLDFFCNDETRNIWQVTRQVTMDSKHRKDVLYKNRYDVTVLVNGLPLVQIELKRPGVEIDEAINQINRYRRYSFRGLFRFIQVFVVSNSVQTKYFANMNENDVNGEEQNIPKSLAFYWTDRDNTRINKLIDFTSDFFKPQSVTDLLDRFMVVKTSEPTLMVMRPYQIYAVREALHRIFGSSMNGYVFHTTGSGKTLTSFKLASILRDDHRVCKVFFLIDRKDLDDQTVDEYNSFEEGCVDNTDNTKELISALADTSKKLIITTIQKMSAMLSYERKIDNYKVKSQNCPDSEKVYNESQLEQWKSVKALIKGFAEERCIFIIDECHRSQFGLMHQSLQKGFPKGLFIGFTGTPIMKENKSADGRTTADIFKAGTADPCLHKYRIREAIADGNVLRFSVEYMRTVGSKQGVDPDKLEDADYCKRHKIDINEIYHAPERMKLVADNILETLPTHTQPGNGRDKYTAIFACDSIPSLLWYYDYIKKNNKNYRIAAIFSYNQNGDDGDGQAYGSKLEDCMKDYSAMFGKAYDLTTFDAYRRDIADRLKQKKEDQIDLLLVVNMFLTGFDSKPTNTLILDKNLVWHSLLQAYSRTNRVYKKTKQFGRIITYRNIKEAQDNALKLFSGDGNPDDYLLQSYDFYLTEYRKYVEELRKVCATGEEAGYIVDEDTMKSFVRAFRPVARTLMTLKTFTKFDWNDLAVFLDEDEYTEYKTWYLSIFDSQKEIAKKGKTTELMDIDFEIELVRTDRINVAYILRLLGEIDRTDTKKINEAVDLILRELERTDNEKLRYKRNLMKTFITDTFYKLPANADIVKAYEQFEKDCMERDVKAFAEQNNLSVEIVNDVMVQYFTNNEVFSKDEIRRRTAHLKLGLLKMTKLITNFQFFVKDMYDKYTAEGV